MNQTNKQTNEFCTEHRYIEDRIQDVENKIDRLDKSLSGIFLVLVTIIVEVALTRII